jgi:hypothetical protein
MGMLSRQMNHSVACNRNPSFEAELQKSGPDFKSTPSKKSGREEDRLPLDEHAAE